MRLLRIPTRIPTARPARVRLAALSCLAAAALPAAAQTAAPAAPAQASSAPAAGGVQRVDITGNVAGDATTEGSHSYTASRSTAGLGEGSIRETPNSISVVTRQRIEDMNLVTLDDAMKYATGITVTTYGTNSSQLTSRGYAIDHYAMDGLSSSARVYENNFDLAMFDRVEVWRGPAGLMQGSGDPGGTVNFVRKRALGKFDFNGRIAGGSWNSEYAEGDVTGPLNADGTVRARVVASYRHNDYFTDAATTRDPMVYATLEADLTPDTTLSVGNSWTRNRSRPFYGLSAYDDGTYPDLSRSTYLGASWANDTEEADRAFVELEQRLSGGGSVRLSAVRVDRHNHGEIAWGNTYVDRATGDVEMIPYFSRGAENEIDFDLRATLPFQWGGLKQEAIVGASSQRLRSSSAYNSSTWGENGFTLNVFDPDIDVPKPDVAIDPADVSRQVQRSVFGQARLKPARDWTVLVGGRLSWFRSEDLTTPGDDGPLKVEARLVPYLGAVWDLARSTSVYASWTNIFDPQSDVDANGNFLPPRKGNQFEAGVKGEYFGGALNTSAAIYRIEDSNRAMTPANAIFPVAAGLVRSQGVDLEATGRVAADWDVVAGYGYNTTRQVRESAADAGTPFNSMFPRHLLSLWTHWRAPEGAARGLELGAGARLRSTIFNTGVNDAGVSARYASPAVTVFGVQAAYPVAPRTRLSLDVENLFDRKYIERPESGWRQTYYGSPRSVTLALSYNQ